jgi:hypothetical protein
MVGATRGQVNVLRAKLSFNPPAYQSAPQGQECLVNVRPLVVNNSSGNLVVRAAGPPKVDLQEVR